ncbi:LOW QUALITY PROTEIN: hypothetical protein OSB04_030181 [Centaurea solstitialis]|uniref:Late embryogenesis abundant protein LEA-2 subgroup domain-containing protein n=1 Tax=Centaurea solstitialis TaxID=347529 RepID=A0AA38S7Y4_9ASTR|nr:LOW QUALITY PROTEIN: hypothetical protein OSB04_030181 [Centaurea solstitialis]
MEKDNNAFHLTSSSNKLLETDMDHIRTNLHTTMFNTTFPTFTYIISYGTMAVDHSLPLLSNSARRTVTKPSNPRFHPPFHGWRFLGTPWARLLNPWRPILYRPAVLPLFDLQEVGVEYLNYSVNTPTTTAPVSLAIRMLFKAENDNYLGLEYGASSFSIMYRGVPLGWATLAGFYLHYNDGKRVQTTVTVDRVNLDNAADFVRDALLHDRVELWITGDVNVNMTTGKSRRGPTKNTTTVSTLRFRLFYKLKYVNHITYMVSIDCVIAVSPRKQALISKLCGPLVQSLLIIHLHAMTPVHPSPPSSHPQSAAAAAEALHNYQKRRRCAVIFGLSCFAIIFIALLVVLILYVRTPDQEPIKPRFELEQVGVEYLNYSVNGSSTASVSLAVRMLFMAENDNDDSIEYGVSSFNIMYRGVPLGRATLPAFCLDGVTRVQTTVTADRVNLEDAADFVRDASLNDRVELRIMGDVNAYIFIWTGSGTSTITTPVSVDCVIAISPRKQALTSKLCGSDVLKFDM